MSKDNFLELVNEVIVSRGGSDDHKKQQQLRFIKDELIQLRTQVQQEDFTPLTNYLRHGISIQNVEFGNEMDYEFFKYLLRQLLNTMNVVSQEYLVMQGLDWQHCNLLKFFELSQVLESCERQQQGLCKNNCLAKKKLELRLYFEFSNQLTLPKLEILNRITQLFRDLLVCDQRHLARHIKIECFEITTQQKFAVNQIELLNEIHLLLQADQMFMEKLH